ncbi:MAG: aldo/keto reductase [Muribaculaceae bacterium]|nr:aldo/keto reductase [Muribaculaceae bacterium]
MEKRVLSNGVEIPVIGYGTYKVSEGHDGVQAVTDALKAGYRLIDTAALYGNESEVGSAIEESGIERSELFVTSKVANGDRGYDSTLRAFERSLELLKLDYLDLYLIHWPASEARFPDWKKINAETWRAMEKLLEDGKVRAIGVSNFMPLHLDALTERASVLPMVNQIEYHPGCMQPEVVEWCNQHAVLVEGWSPLGRTRVLENPLLIDLAGKYHKTSAQICLRWAVQNGVVPLPKSVNPERMKTNLDIFDFTISEEDMNLISGMLPTGESGLTPDTINF